MRRLPLLADHFASRTVQASKITRTWLRQQGIDVAPGQDVREAVVAAGFLIKDAALLSVDAGVFREDQEGTTPRDRATKIISERRLVIGFDYVSQVTQPFSIFLDPPLTRLDELFIKKGSAHVASLSKAEASALSEKTFLSRVSMLTETSKMGCFSWNLPAGPPKLGGTCPSASLGFMYSTAEDAQRQGGDVLETGKATKAAYRLDASVSPIDYASFICNGCYALKGNYKYPSNLTGMLVRLALVRTLLRGPGASSSKGVFFVDGDAYHRAKIGGATASEAVRAAFLKKDAKEVATGGKDGVRCLAWAFKTAILCADVYSRATRAGQKAFSYSSDDYLKVRRMYEENVQIATGEKVKSPTATATARTQASYAWATPEPGYFRIHDSGDFFSHDYWEAWRIAMVELPDVRFWAPNRTWAHSSPTVSPSEIPENLAMRPSALHFNDPPPSRETLRRISLPIWSKGKGGGFAAGSGSGDPSMMHKVKGTPFHAFNAEPGEHFWECPAYAYWTQGGGSVFGSEKAPAGGTCILARGPNNEKGCRACWGGSKGEYTSVGVVYHQH